LKVVSNNGRPEIANKRIFMTELSRQNQLLHGSVSYFLCQQLAGAPFIL